VQGFLSVKGTWALPFGITLEGLSCAVILIYAVANPTSILGRILNNRVIVHIGMISYGIYLWQQLFVFSEPLSQFPLNTVFILICAELSYFLVEKPSYWLRDIVLRRFSPRNASV